MIFITTGSKLTPISLYNFSSSFCSLMKVVLGLYIYSNLFISFNFLCSFGLLFIFNGFNFILEFLFFLFFGLFFLLELEVFFIVTLGDLFDLLSFISKDTSVLFTFIFIFFITKF